MDYNREWHPDDPTIALWKRLLRKPERDPSGRKKTAKQKRHLSKARRAWTDKYGKRGES